MINSQILLESEEQLIITKEEEREDMLSLVSSIHENIMVIEKAGIEKCDTPEPFSGSTK